MGDVDDPTIEEPTDALVRVTDGRLEEVAAVRQTAQPDAAQWHERFTKKDDGVVKASCSR